MKWNGDLRTINILAQLSDKGLVDISSGDRDGKFILIPFRELQVGPPTPVVAGDFFNMCRIRVAPG